MPGKWHLVPGLASIGKEFQRLTSSRNSYQNICMGFVKSTVFRWSKLKFNKTPVFPSFYKIKGFIAKSNNPFNILFATSA